jgi:phage baseplate assembly protein W
MLISIYVATIKLQTLAKPQSLPQSFTYSDLHLDLQYEYLVNNEFLRQPEITDVKLDYDLGAIKNSIINIFLTIPGQKILNPFFGSNLTQYLFQPCDEDTANLIGQHIQECITTFEPRVSILQINVIAMPDSHSYTVTLVLNIPTLNNTSFQIVGTLSNSGFYIN